VTKALILTIEMVTTDEIHLVCFETAYSGVCPVSDSNCVNMSAVVSISVHTGSNPMTKALILTIEMETTDEIHLVFLQRY